ncbi:MAG: hypothetical protein K6U79_06240 [Firmicutes bacterium]|nr:hypothetical protein [Bacillota bacterium]
MPGGWEVYGIAFHDLRLWEPIALGEGLSATAVEATHARGETCVNYLLERDGRRLLQGHDTGWWPEVTWEFLATWPLDVVLLDCTHGPRPASPGHLNVEGVVAAREALAKAGALADGARVIATHFSHNGGWLHAQLQHYFAPHGIEVAYDGMALDF